MKKILFYLLMCLIVLPKVVQADVMSLTTFGTSSTVVGGNVTYFIDGKVALFNVTIKYDSKVLQYVNAAVLRESAMNSSCVDIKQSSGTITIKKTCGLDNPYISLEFKALEVPSGNNTAVEVSVSDAYYFYQGDENQKSPANFQSTPSKITTKVTSVTCPTCPEEKNCPEQVKEESMINYVSYGANALLAIGLVICLMKFKRI